MQAANDNLQERHRIGALQNIFLRSFSVIADVLLFMLLGLAFFPFIGPALSGIVVWLVGTVCATIVLFSFFMSGCIKAGSARVMVRMFTTMTPAVLPLLFITSITPNFTLFTFLTIRDVRKEDAEYNKTIQKKREENEKQQQQLQQNAAEQYMAQQEAVTRMAANQNRAEEDTLAETESYTRIMANLHAINDTQPHVQKAA